METTGFVTGSFDLLSVADIDLVAQARQHCDRLIVGVWTTDLVDRIQGRPPVTPLEERVTLVGHLRGVDGVVVQEVEDEQPEGIDVVLQLAGSSTMAQGRSTRRVTLSPGRTTRSRILREALLALPTRVVA